MNTKCVYTAIFGSFDEPKPVLKPNPEWDYILFTDDTLITSVNGWDKIIHLPREENTRLLARKVKILAHKYLPPQYKTSVWIDASYSISGDIDFIYKPYKNSDFAVAIHPGHRESVYEEAAKVLEYGLDKYDVVAEQTNRYREEGFEGTFRNQVYQCGVLIRKNKPQINNLMERWMEEIEVGSIRDQISLPYVLWKYFDDKLIFSKMSQGVLGIVLKYLPHVKKINNLYFISPYGFHTKIGDRLNYEISALPDDAWIVLTDQDASFLTNRVGDLLNDTINRYPDTDLFSCYTNRLGLSYQIAPEVDPENFDLRYHYDLAQSRRKIYYSTATDIDKPVAGFFMMFPRKTWERHRFQQKLVDLKKAINGKRGVYFDYDFSYRVLQGGGKVRLIEGLYMLHVYRMNGATNIEHLQKVI